MQWSTVVASVALITAPVTIGSGITEAGYNGATAETVNTVTDPVIEAAKVGDFNRIKSLVRDGATVNGSQGDGMTALHWASRNGNSDITEFLLASGAQVNVVTRLGGYTALHLAAQSGQRVTVRLLLEAGANTDRATTAGGVLPLHFAAASGDGETVAVLVEYGADVNARETQWGQTPLMFAAAKNRVASVKTLIRAHADVSTTAIVVDIRARAALDQADRQKRNRRVAGLPEAPTNEAGDVATTADAPLTAQESAALILQEGETKGPLSYSDLVGTQGGLTALLLAVREGHTETVDALLEGGANINQVGAGDQTSPLLMASINGHFDLAWHLLELGADVSLKSIAGATPLYGALNMEWAPKSRFPQPTDSHQQSVSYLELMEAFLVAGADPNARLNRRLWYTSYSRDMLGVNRTGATTFWRAAHATDVPAMKLLVSYGADPGIGTLMTPPGKPRPGRGNPGPDLSGLPPIPLGGNAVMPIHAAAGVGYGQGYAGNIHRHAPDGWLPTLKYLVEDFGADVNARDLNGYTPLHHAASRGDNEMIRYLVEHGADATTVSRRGQTTADMANGPVQRISPFPETVALLESLGSLNNHRCLSC